MLLAGAGLVAAAVAGAAGARDRVAGSQLRLAAAGGARRAASLAAVAPVLTAGVVGASRRPAARWSVATRCCCRRSSPPRAPAGPAADPGPARPRPDGRLSYALLRSDGPRTGDAELAPDVRTGRPGWTPRSPISPPAAAATPPAGLVPYGVRFVLLTTPVDRAGWPAPSTGARCASGSAASRRPAALAGRLPGGPGPGAAARCTGGAGRRRRRRRRWCCPPGRSGPHADVARRCRRPAAGARRPADPAGGRPSTGRL